jgi:hypothetical protein
MELRAKKQKKDREELEIKIMKYRSLARRAIADDESRQRIETLVAELEQKLREIDESPDLDR